MPYHLATPALRTDFTVRVTSGQAAMVGVIIPVMKPVSPGTPQFQRVSLPLVILVGILTGLLFAVIIGTVPTRARVYRVVCYL